MSVGDKYTWWVKTAVGSDTPIQLRPTWGYSEVDMQTKRFNTTQGGQLNIYSHVSSYQNYTLPLDFVNSEQSSIINSWWSTNTKLHFTVNDSFTGNFFTVEDSYLGLLDKSYNPLIDYVVQTNLTVRIQNINQPLNKYRGGRISDFQGNLFLTITG